MRPLRFAHAAAARSPRGATTAALTRVRRVAATDARRTRPLRALAHRAAALRLARRRAGERLRRPRARRRVAGAHRGRRRAAQRAGRRAATSCTRSSATASPGTARCVRQSERTTQPTRAALRRLAPRRRACSPAPARAASSRAAPLGPGGERVYPGTCREGIPRRSTRTPPARLAPRVRVGRRRRSRSVDRLQGPQRQDLAREVGDFVVRRADGLYRLPARRGRRRRGAGGHRRRARRRPARLDAAPDLPAAAPRAATPDVPARAGRDQSPGARSCPSRRARRRCPTTRCRRCSPPGVSSTSRCPTSRARDRWRSSGSMRSRAWSPPRLPPVRDAARAGDLRLRRRSAASPGGIIGRFPPRRPRASGRRAGSPPSRGPRRMTTLVVVRKNDEIAIAADSLTTFGDTRLSADYDRTSDKIVQLPRAPTSACAAAPRTSSCSRACSPRTTISTSRTRSRSSRRFRKLHPILKEQHFLNPKEEEDDPYESTQITALVANEHGIFGVYSMREVFEYTQFWAAGSGREFALGAMHALYPRLRTAAAIAKAGHRGRRDVRQELRAADDALHHRGGLRVKRRRAVPEASPQRAARRCPVERRRRPALAVRVRARAVRGALVSLDATREILACHPYPPALAARARGALRRRGAARLDAQVRRQPDRAAAGRRPGAPARRRVQRRARRCARRRSGTPPPRRCRATLRSASSRADRSTAGSPSRSTRGTAARSTRASSRSRPSRSRR